MPVKATAKSTYHHGDLEGALVQAAIKLVRKYGPDHLSLRAVSAEVGVSPSASYHYFKDKDALVAAVGDVLFDQLGTMQEKAIAKVKGKGAEGALKKFEAMGYAYFKWATSEPNLYRLIFGGFCEHHMDEHQSKAWILLQQTLDDLAANKLMDKSVRAGGEIVVWSAVHGASSLAIEGLMPEEAYPVVMKSIERSLGLASN
jgi:AcrR family transcriptional regulator